MIPTTLNTKKKFVHNDMDQKAIITKTKHNQLFFDYQHQGQGRWVDIPEFIRMNPRDWQDLYIFDDKNDLENISVKTYIGLISAWLIDENKLKDESCYCEHKFTNRLRIDINDMPIIMVSSIYGYILSHDSPANNLFIKEGDDIHVIWSKGKLVCNISLEHLARIHMAMITERNMNTTKP